MAEKKPTPPTGISPEQGKKITEWLDGNANGPQPCPVCGSQNWIIADDLVTPARISLEGAMQIGGTMYPQVMVVCGQCAYTRFFNAALMGVVADKPPPEGD